MSAEYPVVRVKHLASRCLPPHAESRLLMSVETPEVGVKLSASALPALMLQVWSCSSIRP